MVKNVNHTARLQLKVDTIKNCIYLQCASFLAWPTKLLSQNALNKKIKSSLAKYLRKRISNDLVCLKSRITKMSIMVVYDTEECLPNIMGEPGGP